ncbi:MAG TPA: hypothetical protein VGP53_04565, partial [Acidimicrobiales bacterium]|nr:hypothetical protein [Acidimicrobiales bacterium]
SPEWRRQEREGHAVGILLLVLPSLLGAGLGAAHLGPLRLVGSAVPLFVVPALLWRVGPRFGFDRRAACLVAVPVLGLFVHVAFAWRLGHHRTRTWKTLEPSWGRNAWTVLTVVGVLSWIWTVATIVLA